MSHNLIIELSKYIFRKLIKNIEFDDDVLEDLAIDDDEEYSGIEDEISYIKTKKVSDMSEITTKYMSHTKASLTHQVYKDPNWMKYITYARYQVTINDIKRDNFKNVSSDGLKELKQWFKNLNLIVNLVDSTFDNRAIPKRADAAYFSKFSMINVRFKSDYIHFDKLSYYLKNKIKSLDYFNSRQFKLESHHLISFIVHELQHAYDDWKSGGKFDDSKYTDQYNLALKFRKELKKSNIDFKIDYNNSVEFYKFYQKLPHEISSHFTQFLYLLSVGQYKENEYSNRKLSLNSPFKTIANAWKNNWTVFKDSEGYTKEYLEKISKRLIGRLYDEWWNANKHKIDNTGTSVEQKVKSFNKLKDRLKSYNSNIRIWHSIKNSNYIEIDSLPYWSMEEDVWSEILKFSKIHKVNIGLNLDKGWTYESNKSKGEKYIKDLGFRRNKGTYKDFKTQKMWYYHPPTKK